MRSSSLYKTTESQKVEENLLDRLTDGFTIVDEKGTIQFINKTAAYQFGISKDEVTGRKINELILEIKDCSKIDDLVVESFQGNPPRPGRYHVLFSNKKTSLLDLNFSVSHLADSENSQLIIQHKPVDDGPSSDQLSRHQDNQLYTNLESYPDEMLNVDHKGTILFVNQNSKNLKAKEAIGKTIYDYSLPEDHAAIKQELKKVYQSGEEGRYESGGIGSDGIVRWYSTRVVPIKHDDGVIGVSLGMSDNSQKKAAEDELKKSQALLNTIFDSIPETILVLDRRMNIVACNSKGTEKFGLQSQTRKRKCYDIYWQRKEPCTDCQIKTVFETGKSSIRELYNEIENTHKEIRAFPVLSDTGAVRYVVEYIQDITKTKENKEMLELATQKSKAAQRIKSDFLSKIGHELKTPMIGILGFAKLGMERYKKNSKEKLKSYFSTIYESAEKLQGLLNNMLDLSQLEVGNLGYDYQKEHLSMVTTIILNDMFTVFKDKSIKIKYTKPTFTDLVQIDVEKIGKVMKNLLLNAVKYSKKGSQIKVEIAQTTDNRVQFSVTDTGHGIPDDELESIFEKFKQGSSHEEFSGGTGLGLAISKKIISDHDGKIWAENNKRVGSTFIFTLPRVESEGEM